MNGETNVTMDPSDIQKIMEYNVSMMEGCEVLGYVLVEHGVSDFETDQDVMEIAARKIKTLFNMVLATGVNRGLLEAVMAGD